MSDIIQQIRDAYAENPAAALKRMPELFKQYDDGLIPVLPCKVGDTVYLVDDTIHHKVIPYTICKISFERGEALFWYSVEWCDAPLALCGINDFGKTVFLSREAAEAALKEHKA